MALFRSSNHKGFTQVVRHRMPARFNNVTGEPIEWHRRLAADFGQFGAEQTIINPETGNPIVVADIRGGFYDSVAAQQREGLTDEEREAIEEKLREEARIHPGYVQEVVAVHVPASAPWQTFNDMDPADVVKTAKLLGLEPESLRFERENLARPEVLEPLGKIVAALPPEEQARANPIMQIPDGELALGHGQQVPIGSPPEFTDTGIVKGTPGFVEKQGSSHTITI